MAVLEFPVQTAAVGETGHPEALAEMIFGSLAGAVPAGELALTVDRDLAMEGARDPERVAALDRAVEAVEPGRTQVQGAGEVRERSPREASLPLWAGGAPLPRY